MPWHSGSAQDEEIVSAPVTEPVGVVAEEGRFGIPIPEDFTLDRDSSFTFENDDLRVAKLVYTGKGKLAEIVQFYLDRIPGDGWKQGNVVEHDEVQLRFTNESSGEELEIVVAQHRWNEVILRIMLTPAGSKHVGGL